MDAVRRDLDIILEQKDFEDGGLRVFTTLDHRLQISAEIAGEARKRRGKAESLPTHHQSSMRPG